MTEDTVRHLAQRDPTENLTNQFGAFATATRRAVDDLTRVLRELDKIQAQLAERDITVSVDLGPIGNAAAAARRDLEKQRDTPEFVMPTHHPQPPKSFPSDTLRRS